MKQAPRSGQGEPAQVKITESTEDDLPAIVGILNYTAANSIARFETRPVSVAGRRDWFGQFSATGPYRLLVARSGDQVRGFACSQRYRDLEAFRETVEVSIALDVSSRGQGVGSTSARYGCSAFFAPRRHPGSSRCPEPDSPGVPHELHVHTATACANRPPVSPGERPG